MLSPQSSRILILYSNKQNFNNDNLDKKINLIQDGALCDTQREYFDFFIYKQKYFEEKICKESQHIILKTDLPISSRLYCSSSKEEI